MSEFTQILRERTRIAACGGILLFLAACGKEPSSTEIVRMYDREAPEVSTPAVTTSEPQTSLKSEDFVFIINGAVECPAVVSGWLGFNLDGTYVHQTPDGKLHSGQNAFPFESREHGVDVFCSNAG